MINFFDLKIIINNIIEIILYINISKIETSNPIKGILNILKVNDSFNVVLLILLLKLIVFKNLNK